MQLEKIFYGGGMDTDSAIEYIDKTDYISAWNIRNTGTEGQELGYITSLEGTVQIPFTLPNGINKCIGGKVFKQFRKAYAFIYNSNRFHTITEFDFDTNIITKVFQNKTDSSGNDILNLNPERYVEDIGLINGELYFLPSNRVPSKANIERLKSGYYGVVQAQDLALIKAKPKDIITYSYLDDSTKSSNLIENQLIKFAYKFIYNNNEESVFSELSKVYVPVSGQTSAGSSGKNNALQINVPVPDDRVATVVIAAKINDSTQWVEVKRTDRATILGLPSTIDLLTEVYEIYSGGIYSFVFYNNGLYLPIDELETDLEYDRVPQTAQAQEVLNGNILSYGNIEEGFDPVEIDVDVSVTYTQILQEQLPTDTNYFRPIGDSGSQVGFNQWRWDVYFKGVVKTGDVIEIKTKDVRDSSVSVYNYTVPPAYNNDTLGALNNMAAIAGFPFGAAVTYRSSDQVYTIIFKLNYYHVLLSREVRNFNVGSSEFRSVSTLKLNSNRQYAIMYEYPYGRLGGVLTNDSMVAPTKSYATTNGFSPVVSLTINHTPPTDAIGYYILSSGQLTHLNTVYMVGRLIEPVAFDGGGTYQIGNYVIYDGKVYRSIVNNNTDDPTNTGKWTQIGNINDIVNASYLAFDVTSFKKFNDKNSSSVLSYSYTEGDRANFAYYEDAGDLIYFDTTPIDNSVTGFVSEAINGDVNNLDSGRILKVQKGSINSTTISGKNVLIEVYTPKRTTEDNNLFYTIGERYDIVNEEHEQTQILIDKGEVYFKTREYVNPSDFNDFNTYNVEDFNYSDFAPTRVDDLGRAYIYNKNAKKTTLKAAIRYGDIFNESTGFNQLNRFKSENIYGLIDGQTTSIHGGIMKMRQRASSLLVFQELEVGYIPVNVTIFEGVEGQSNVAISDKLLNNIRYNGNGIGIGMFTKSFAEYNGDYYFVDPNKSEPFKADSGGIRSLAGRMSKFFKEKLQPLAITRRNLIGIYDEYYREYKLSAESDSGVVIEVSLEDGDWTGDTYSVLPAQITINDGAHNTISYNTTTGKATYTPDTDYIGSDSFTFQFGSVTRNVCMSVVAGDITPDQFTFEDLVGVDLSTEFISNPVLITGTNVPVEIFVTGTGEYSIDEGAWTSVDGIINPNSSVRLKQTSAATDATAKDLTLTVGGTSDTWTLTTSEEVITFPEFDFMTLRMMWNYPADGKDLDIAVGYVGTGVVSADDRYVGFGQNNGSIVPTGAVGEDSYLWWALDDTNPTNPDDGIEAVLIGIRKFIDDNPSAPNLIDIDLYAWWYTSRNSGDVTVEIKTYLGGTMSVVGTDFVNTGGTEESSDSVVVNITRVKGSDPVLPANMQKIGTVTYDKLSNTASLNLI